MGEKEQDRKGTEATAVSGQEQLAVGTPKAHPASPSRWT